MLQIVRPELLDDLELSIGNHPSGDTMQCFMEAFAKLTGQQHTDHPCGVEDRIAMLMRSYNDCFVGTRQERAQWLKPMFVEVLNTAPTTRYSWCSPRVSDALQRDNPFAPMRTRRAALQWIKTLCALAKQDIADGKLHDAPTILPGMVAWTPAQQETPASEMHVWALAEHIFPQSLTKSLTVAGVAPSS